MIQFGAAIPVVMHVNGEVARTFGEIKNAYKPIAEYLTKYPRKDLAPIKDDQAAFVSSNKDISLADEAKGTTTQVLFTNDHFLRFKEAFDTNNSEAQQKIVDEYRGEMNIYLSKHGDSFEVVHIQYDGPEQE